MSKKTDKRLSKTLGKSIAVSQQPKKQKRLTKSGPYNHFFSVVEANDALPEEESVILVTEETEKSSIDPNDRNENTENVLSNEQLVQMMKRFSAVNKIVLTQLTSACDKLRAYRTTSTLGIRDTEISDDDVPLLTIFEKYNLPLKTKEEVDALENELDKSNDFLRFFVSTELLVFYSSQQG